MRGRDAVYFAFFTIIAWIVCADLLLGRAYMLDFQSFYGAAEAVKRDLDPYDAHVIDAIARESDLRGPIYPYLYSPFVAYGMSWLADVRHDLAQTLWSYMSIVAYGLSSMFAMRCAVTKQAAGWLVVITALLAFALPLRGNINIGQINALVLALICAALWLAHSDRPFSAGFTLAFAVVIKIMPLVLALPWLLERRLRALVGLAAGLVAAFLITLPFGGAGAWLEFARRLPTMSHGSTIPGLFPAKTHWSFSLASFYARLFDSPSAVRIASIATIIALVAGIAFVARRKSTEHVLLPLSVVMIVASPLAYTHHVIYLLPGLLLALHLALRDERRVLAGALLVLGALASTEFPNVYTSGWPTLALSLNLYALLALYGIGVWSMSK